MLKDVSEIINAISSIRISGMPDEYDIHRLVEDAFLKRGLSYTHEAPLGKGRRVDFLVGKTAVEIKKGAPASSAVQKQITGYLESDSVEEIIVVTRKRLRLPAKIGGKQVFILILDRLWGVSFP